MENSIHPIGVFDSGVGGLTVLSSLLKTLPNERFIYLGDTARLPYGTKSAETIYRYSIQICQYLKKLNVKAIVIACNSASSHFPQDEFEGIPVFKVIDPGAEKANEFSVNKKIGVLGTRATIQSGSYTQALWKLNSKIEVFPQACPLFVPLAEEGLNQDPITNLIAYRYIQPLVASGIDTLIMGCTHYPILADAIQKAAGNSITLIDPGLAVSEKLAMQFKALNQSLGNQPDIEILSTDGSQHFLTLAEYILKNSQLKIKYSTVDL